jgi:hypothetical protein
MWLSALTIFAPGLIPFFQLAGGDERVRTADPLLARQVLSQLSYTPSWLSSLEITSTIHFALLVQEPSMFFTYTLERR